MGKLIVHCPKELEEAIRQAVAFDSRRLEEATAKARDGSLLDIARAALQAHQDAKAVSSLLANLAYLVDYASKQDGSRVHLYRDHASDPVPPSFFFDWCTVTDADAQSITFTGKRQMNGGIIWHGEYYGMHT